MQKGILILLMVLVLLAKTKAQQKDLLQLATDSLEALPVSHVVRGTFKGTHIINMQSIEQPAQKELLFIIMHRFGKLNDGAYNLFGLDQAEIRLGLDYGLTERLSIGMGRSSFDKAFDGSLKYKIVRQKSRQSLPFSITGYSEVVLPTIRYADKPYLNTRYRLIYANQLLIARKFTENLSIQVSPSWLHFNLVEKAIDDNDIFMLGIGGRMKFNKRMSINVEYNYLSKNVKPSAKLTRSFSAGWDIETGGHVFQLVFSNSVGMVLPYFAAKTTGTWSAGDIYFGFNVSRSFSFRKR